MHNDTSDTTEDNSALAYWLGPVAEQHEDCFGCYDKERVSEFEAIQAGH